MEERISNHMTITQVDVREVESEEEEEESEEEEEVIEMPEITDEMNEVIRRASNSQGEVLVDSHKIQITRKDIDTLKGLNWLNDEVINFYMQVSIFVGEPPNK